MTPPITSGRFDGHIAGVGTAIGTRFVIGLWDDTPFGPITDVMVEQPDGHRVLVAPNDAAARFIAATYRFDEVRVELFTRHLSGKVLEVHAASVRLRLMLGRRTALGWLLRAVPRRLARARWWARVLDPIARRVRPGVRTFGTAGGGREERYCALDERAVVAVDAWWQDADQGALRPVAPPVRFGFGSAPSQPSCVRVTTFVDDRG